MFRSFQSCLLPLVALALLCPGTAYGQDPPPPPDLPPGSTGNPLDRELAEEERARERAVESNRRADLARLGVSITPEARANRETIENYYVKLRLWRFLDDLIDFSLQVRAIHAFRFAPMSEPWAIRDLERRVDKLDDRTEDLIDFIDWGWDLPEPDLVPLRVESDISRINGITAMSRNLVPRIVELTTGDLLNLGVQSEVRYDLFVMRQMIRSLED